MFFTRAITDRRITRALTAPRAGVAGIALTGAAAAALSLAPNPAHAATDHADTQTAKAHAAVAQVTADQHKKSDDDTKGKKADQHESAAERQTAEIAKIAKDTDHKYADNLNGWIHQALDIMKIKHIPGSYEGVHRNIMRESSGNPNAENDWDINAINGVPSKGLLQVIQPTFDKFHVAGTKDKLTDPVANIVAACNYAADRYGSMDNVNSAY
jgi:hypothetical protein